MIEYTIVVVNNSPDKSFNVTVGDLLPDGVKFISSNGQYNPDTGVWFVGDGGVIISLQRAVRTTAVMASTWRVCWLVGCLGDGVCVWCLGDVGVITSLQWLVWCGGWSWLT